jgi:ribulose-5-phosphate 4-epimerase/fuculose-1-phosphate aldolase
VRLSARGVNSAVTSYRTLTPPRQVAWACRILASEGFSDLTLGHASVRPSGSDVIFIKRKGPALEEVTPADVVTVEYRNDAALAAPGLHLETAMHTAVYRERPDVGAVIHAHPPYATALGATEGRLEFLTHDAALFAEGISVYEATHGLISAPELGRDVTNALGTRRVVLLRNHGVLVADKDIGWAVLAAVTLERAIRLQVTANALGPPRPYSQASADQLYPEKYRDAFVEEYWAAWARRCGLG